MYKIFIFKLCTNKNWEKIMSEDPVFWQYWVKNAEGYILTNFNTDAKIANGTSFYCHTLVFDKPDEKEWFLEKVKSAQPGTIISLKSPPLAVNVELFRHERNKRLSWNRKTLEREKVVVSILGRYNDNKWKKYLVCGGLDYGYQPSYVKTRNTFPFELGFSMTIHKSQGRTLKAVILTLSERPTHKAQIDYCGFFVELSRVQGSEDIRHILLKKKDYSSLKYLTLLEQPEHIGQFFKGFTKRGTNWDPNLAYNEILN